MLKCVTLTSRGRCGRDMFLSHFRIERYKNWLSSEFSRTVYCKGGNPHSFFKEGKNLRTTTTVLAGPLPVVLAGACERGDVSIVTADVVASLARIVQHTTVGCATTVHCQWRDKLIIYMHSQFSLELFYEVAVLMYNIYVYEHIHVGTFKDIIRCAVQDNNQIALNSSNLRLNLGR